MNAARGRSVALAFTTAGFALLAAFAVMFREAAWDWWRRIPVVRTWGDLMAVAPLDLGEGVMVRLGIEGTRCPRSSGVLVYCLTEGYRPDYFSKSVGTLGPLELSVVEKGDTADRRESAAWEDPGRAGTSDTRGRLLFVHSIPIPRTDTFVVKVSTRDGKLLRTVRVQTTSERFHPWLVFEQDRRLLDRLERARPGEERAAVGYVAVRGDGIALPRREGWSPHDPAETRKGLASPDRPLPRLFPPESEIGIGLQVADGVLTVTSTDDLILSMPHRHFLARWWVRGEPYLPGESGPRAYREERGGLEIIPGKKLRLRLDFDPTRLGARRGDRIGLQLLYLDRGWQFIEGLDALSSFAPGCRALLSNKVEFDAP